uniref:Uncharacterized protein n=1 Tax=Rhodnius prolixus TaxID=13249 RepID=T1IB88_RHOPR
MVASFGWSKELAKNGYSLLKIQYTLTLIALYGCLASEIEFLGFQDINSENVLKGVNDTFNVSGGPVMYLGRRRKDFHQIKSSYYGIQTGDILLTKPRS